jgi:hypothetical protein
LRLFWPFLLGFFGFFTPRPTAAQETDRRILPCFRCIILSFFKHTPLFTRFFIVSVVGEGLGPPAGGNAYGKPGLRCHPEAAEWQVRLAFHTGGSKPSPTVIRPPRVWISPCRAPPSRQPIFLFQKNLHFFSISCIILLETRRIHPALGDGRRPPPLFVTTHRCRANERFFHPMASRWSFLLGRILHVSARSPRGEVCLFSG